MSSKVSAWDMAWEASEYRSITVRERERSKFRRSDITKLGNPTYVDALPWSSHLKALLCGVKDPQSPLSLLSGLENNILKAIYEMVVEDWKHNIVICPPAQNVGLAFPRNDWSDENKAKVEDYDEGVHSYVWGNNSMNAIGQREEDRPEIAFSLVGTVSWPEPTGRNVNMLPFIMGDKDSLPDELRPYYELIKKCPVNHHEQGRVVYLTVSEGYVDAKSTQRRSGLHIEAAGGIADGVEGSFQAGEESNWGGGVYWGGGFSSSASPDDFEGGLYMASNMNDTCMLWDALVNKGKGMTDFHGGGEHLRPFIGEGTMLKANELAWLTDRTPHEALPQTKSGYRQFFRLVTSNISVWFKEHSTPNPKVPIPDYVQIVEGNKFSSPIHETTIDESKPPATKKLKAGA